MFTQSIAFPFLLHTKNMLKLFKIIWIVFKLNETFYIKNLKLMRNNMHTVFKSLHMVEIYSTYNRIAANKEKQGIYEGADLRSHWLYPCCLDLHPQLLLSAPSVAYCTTWAPEPQKLPTAPQASCLKRTEWSVKICC